MNYKDNLGIEAGCRSVKIPDHIVSTDEGREIAVKAKERISNERSTELRKCTEKSLHENVKKGNLTASQAEQISRGIPINQFFNK